MKNLIWVLLLSSTLIYSQKGCMVYGKIKFVEYNEDYRVKFVSKYGEDLKVKFVNYNEYEVGKWKVVEFNPDWKIKIVKYDPDFVVREVEYFQGCRQ